MTIPKFSEATLQRYANSKSFGRGEDYYHQGAVLSITQRGSLLVAVIEGNETYPYYASIQFKDDEIANADCTCAYAFDGWCKHIVATLLTCLRQPAKMIERPTLEQLLDRLDEVQTQRLIQNLVAEQPALLDTIDRFTHRLVPPLTPSQPDALPSKRRTLDTAPYRSRTRHILREAVRYLEEGDEDDPISEELFDLIQEAQMLIEQGDGYNAIAILEAITATCVENWDDVEEYGADNDEVAQTLNESLTEAILCAELNDPEKVDLQTNLESWQDEWKADFTMSLEALHQGWDYGPLQNVLQGEITHLGAWEEEAPDYADDLAAIRLKILERQQRYPEYLYLAEAEGQTQRYLTMLARLGRTEEAMQAAQTKMKSMEEAFTLAQTLREREALTQALQIAQRGLTLPGNRLYELATWTSDLAEELGNEEAALAAKVKAFQAKPTFSDYRKIEALARETWDALKPDLLEYLHTYQSWGSEEAKVNIFLHEGLIDDAIASLDLNYSQSHLIHRVMEAAITERPDWVIENAKRRATAIMDAKKAEYYDDAIKWLRKARAAYDQKGQKTEWSAYRTQLMATHARKHKLMGLLKQKDLE